MNDRLIPPGRRPFWVTVFAWGMVAFLTAMYADRHVVRYLAEPARLHANDFKHIYLGSLFLRNGQSPYGAEEFLRAAGTLSRTEDPRFRSILPYVYLPFTGVVLIPLTWMTFPDAVWVWFWINQLLFLWGGWLAARAVGLPRRAAIGALVMFLLAWNDPLSRTLTAGQLNGVLFFCFALVLWMAPRAPSWATGSVAAFAALFKLTPGILFFWFLAERKFRQAAWMVVAGVLLVAATLPIAGLRSYLDFLPVLGQMSYGKSTWSEFGHQFYRDPANQSLNAFYHRVLASDRQGGITPWVRLGEGTANAFTVADTLALVAATAWLVWPRRRRGASEARNPPNSLPLRSVLRCNLLIVLSLLVPSILWDHYLVVLVLPFLALARFLLERGGGRTALGYLALAVIVTGMPIPWDAAPLHSGFGLLVLSAKLLSTLVVWGLLGWALLVSGGGRWEGIDTAGVPGEDGGEEGGRTP